MVHDIDNPTYTWQIKLANPRGFCAGVDRAISIVDRALEIFPTPIYVRHEVVHNKFVVDDFLSRGVVFVDDLREVPENNIVIFSAHGVSQAVRQEAKDRHLKVFDATCPLVTKVHLEISRYNRQGFDCILIGHKGHPEVEGTMGQFDTSFGGDIYLVESVEDVDNLTIKQTDKLFAVTQTTLSLDDTAAISKGLCQRYPQIKFPHKSDICYATQNRQNAVKDLVKEVDVVLVVGSVNSSNSNRLAELAQRMGTPAYLLDSPEQIKLEWLADKKVIGITAGASAPDVLVEQIVAGLGQLGAVRVENLAGEPEDVVFNLPKELK